MSIIDQLRQVEEDNNLDVDLQNIYCDGDNFEEFNEKVLEAIGYMDIVYYSNAIKYLRENDPSLRESLGIAEEYGYEVSSLNSEFLATILYQQRLLDEFYEMSTQIEEILNN